MQPRTAANPSLGGKLAIVLWGVSAWGLPTAVRHRARCLTHVPRVGGRTPGHCYAADRNADILIRWPEPAGAADEIKA
jgi:hypothetical protein